MLSSTASLIVLDLGVGLSAALVADHFAKIGAQLFRLEPESGDPFYNVYPAYRLLRSGATHLDAAQLETMLAKADICITGGEDYPGLERPRYAESLAAGRSRLIVLDLGSYESADSIGRPAVDILAQARTGVCFEQFSGRPILFTPPISMMGAALAGILGVWTAVLQRVRAGKGQIVSVSIEQGIAFWPLTDWVEVRRETERSRWIIPYDPRPTIFRCADGGYLHFMTMSAGALPKLYKVLRIEKEIPPGATGKVGSDNPDTFFGEIDLYAIHIAQWKRDDLLEKLWEEGIPAEAVLEMGESWDHEQTIHHGSIMTEADGWQRVGETISLESMGGETVMARPRALADGEAPLSGLRIVDYGAWAAGPYASKLLASWGADVVKVEPIGGDPQRFNFKYWHPVAQNKRSIAIDLKKPEAREIIAKLMRTSNGAHHNMRPGAVGRIGMDPATLREANPDLVTLETSAHGLTGPKAGNAGYDSILQAVTGLQRRAGGEGPPIFYRSGAPLDFVTGTLGAIGMVIGLVDQASGRGGVAVETSLLDGAMFISAELIRSPDGTFEGIPKLDAGLTGTHPAERMYEAADGWIAIAARSPGMAAILAGIMGLADKPRAAWDEAEARAIAAAVAGNTVAHWLQTLGQAGVWAEPCLRRGWKRMINAAASQDLSLVGRYESEDMGTVTCVGALFDLSAVPNAERPSRRPPEVGEHTREILNELGYSDIEIDRLYAEAVVA